MFTSLDYLLKAKRLPIVGDGKENREEGEESWG